ncbi:hypothetical protein Tco_0770630, partial [Tanacetum coccineum]
INCFLEKAIASFEDVLCCQNDNHCFHCLPHNGDSAIAAAVMWKTMEAMAVMLATEHILKRSYRFLKKEVDAHMEKGNTQTSARLSGVHQRHEGGHKRKGRGKLRVTNTEGNYEGLIH